MLGGRGDLEQPPTTKVVIQGGGCHGGIEARGPENGRGLVPTGSTIQMVVLEPAAAKDRGELDIGRQWLAGGEGADTVPAAAELAGPPTEGIGGGTRARMRLGWNAAGRGEQQRRGNSGENDRTDGPKACKRSRLYVNLTGMVSDQTAVP